MKNHEIIFIGCVYLISTFMAIQPMVGFNPIKSKEHLLKTYIKCLAWPVAIIFYTLKAIVKSWANLPDTTEPNK